MKITGTLTACNLEQGWLAVETARYGSIRLYMPNATYGDGLEVGATVHAQANGDGMLLFRPQPQ